LENLRKLLESVKELLLEESLPPENLSLDVNDVTIFGRLAVLPPKGKLFIIGDLHGEQDSLQEILSFLSDRFKEDRDFIVFLGDYADRGTEGLEVFEELFELKLRLGKRLVLLRGNHESIEMNRFYGFLSELYWKLGPDSQEFYSKLLEIYDILPLAAYVPGKLIMVHGGATVPPITLKQIAEGKEEFQLLWNDPLDDDYMPRGGETRGFSEEELDLFLETVKAKVMVRGHQFVGYKGHKIFGDKLISLFSARYGYEDARIAILEVDLEKEIKDVFQLIEGLHLI